MHCGEARSAARSLRSAADGRSSGSLRSSACSVPSIRFVHPSRQSSSPGKRAHRAPCRRGRKRPPSVRVLRFVDNVYDYMHAADVLVTKPGGLSTAERSWPRSPWFSVSRCRPGGTERSRARRGRSCARTSQTSELRRCSTLFSGIRIDKKDDCSSEAPGAANARSEARR